jgi:YggT family protein
VGAQHADLLVLTDIRSGIGQFLAVFIYVYILLIIGYVLLSWFQIGYGSPLYRVQQFLSDTCGPYLRLFKRFIPPLGPLDVSPMVAIVVLVLIQGAISRYL